MKFSFFYPYHLRLLLLMVRSLTRFLSNTTRREEQQKIDTFTTFVRIFFLRFYLQPVWKFLFLSSLQFHFECACTFYSLSLNGHSLWEFDANLTGFRLKLSELMEKQFFTQSIFRFLHCRDFLSFFPLLLRLKTQSYHFTLIPFEFSPLHAWLEVKNKFSCFCARE